ncbi:MAG: transcriptional repressor [Clostridia bacterium]|nr:transcriptional repressor [Clostridia bacterium]
MRHSSQRDLVFETVKASKNHLTAPEIYEIVRQTMPNISLGTVYRNLKLLSDSSQLETLETTDKTVHYDYVDTPHNHFMCRLCGAILDVFETNAPPSTLCECGVAVESTKTVYYGLCPKCNQK